MAPKIKATAAAEMVGEASGWTEGTEAPKADGGWTEGTEAPAAAPEAPAPLSLKDEYGAEGTQLPPAIPTLSQGSADTFIAPPSESTMEQSYIESNKDTPIIPGMNSTTPQGVRAATAGLTMNAAPRLLALTERRPYKEALHDWHGLYASAREENPQMEFMGGAVTPLPFAKVKAAGKIAIGAAAGALYGWLGADPEDEEAKKDAAKGGALVGGALMGAFHAAPKVVGAIAKKVKSPPRTVVVEPEFVNNLARNLDAVPEVTAKVEAAPKKSWKKPEVETPGVKITKGELKNTSIIEALSKDPSTVTAIHTDKPIAELHPFDASVKIGHEGRLVGTLRELNTKTNKLTIHVTDVDSPVALARWKQALINHHPDTIRSVDEAANARILGDDSLQDAWAPKPSAQFANKGTDAVLPSPADEAPQGATVLTDSLLVHDVDEGWLALNKLQSPSAKIASLRGRDVVAIETPEGTRYGLGRFSRKSSLPAEATPDSRSVVVIPFEANEGMPTIARTAEIGRSKVRMPTDEELTKLANRPIHDASTPDVNEGIAMKGYIEGYVGPKDTPLNIGGEPPGIKTASMGPAEPPKPPLGMESMPPPGPPIPPPPPIAKQLAIMAKVGSMNPLKRQLVHSSQRAEADLADILSDHASLKAISEQKFAYNKALERKLGGVAKVAEFRRDVMLAFEGSIPESKLAEMYPEEVFIPKRKLVTDASNRRDTNDAWFRENGYLEAISKDDLTTAFPKYVNREFLAKGPMAKDYLKVALNDDLKMKLAVEGFKNWELKAGRVIDDAEARLRISQALGAADAEAAGLELFARKPGGKAQAPNAMRTRQDLPPWYRNLLGENRDGFQAIARTISIQEELMQRYKVFEAVSANPAWMVPEEVWLKGGDPSWRPMPTDPKAYGRASGMMAHPFVHDALVTLPNVKHAADGWMAGIYSVMKTNQMGFPSMRTLMNMFASNWEAGMLSGGMDPTRPIASGLASIKANRAMWQFRVDPLKVKDRFKNHEGFSPLSFHKISGPEFIRDLRRIGADAPGHIGLDLNAMQQKSMDQVTDRLIDYKGTKDIKSFWTAAADAHKLAAKPGSVAIDWFDRNQKITSMIMIMDDLMRPNSIFAGKGLGLPYEEALRQAFKRIAYSNPMFDRLPPLAERMRHGLLGAGSPYSSYGFERNRILGQLPGRLQRSVQSYADPALVNEDPGLPFRLLKYGAFMGAALGGGYSAARNWFGEVSDEDVDAALLNRKGTFQEKINPAPWVAPIRIGDQVVVMDMTQFSSGLSIMQGDPTLSPLAKIALNTVRQPLQGGLFGEALDATLKVGGVDMGTIDPKPPALTSTPMDKVAGVADFLAKRGAVPRTPMDLYDRVKDTGALGDQGMRREAMPPVAAGLKAMGAPIEGTQTVGTPGKSPSAFNQLKVEMKQVADIKAAMYSLAIQPPNKAQPVIRSLMDLIAKGDPSEEKRKLFKELGDMLKKTGQEMAAQAKAQRAAKASHETKYKQWVEAPEAETP